MMTRRIVWPQVAGGGVFAVVLLVLGVLVTSAWFRYEALILEIAKDRYSLPLLLGIEVFLYLAIVVARAARQSQYSQYVWGRLQEAYFLRQWPLLVGPLIAVASLSFGFWKEGWQLPATALAWLAAAYSIFQFVKSVSGAWLRPVEHERYFLLEAKASHLPNGLFQKDSDMAVPPGSRALSVRGRKLVVPDTPDWQVAYGFIFHSGVNKALQDDAGTLGSRVVKPVKELFALGEELTNYREIALIHMRAKGGLLYNEQKIRLCADLDRLLHNDAPVGLQRTSYYLSVCSNELTRYIVTPRHAAVTSGTDLFKLVRDDRTGAVVSLARSKLSNHMGGGTLAVTHDGYLITSKQGRLALVASGLYAPAGAGSFDWRDLRPAMTLNELVKAGLERELQEECGYARKDLVRTLILGYGRDMTRGGKPDFFGITLVNSKADPSITTHEVGFVDHHNPIRLSAETPAGLREEIRAISKEHAAQASPSLLMNLEFLAAADDATLQAVLDHIAPNR